MRLLPRLFRLAAILAGVPTLALGYYNWVFFPDGKGPYDNRVVARIDLNQLPSNTVPFFVSDQPPNPMTPGDSFAALLSQIKAAAAVWSGVPSSSLRLAFGGMETIGQTPQTAPGIDVVFDDEMPPGLLAQTRLTLPQDVSFISQGASFVPIARSTVQLRKDLTVYQQASYYDSFFLTLVHEFGHALGLQHTLTSGVMSTDLTRATTKAAPLSADDIAGVSMLYPAAGYLAATGSISGAVQIGGVGVNLASVVALATDADSTNYGVAISAMTNPDGTYTMGGVPPGHYYVYAHPLPPAQNGEATPDNIVPPVDAGGTPFPANTGMDTQFFGDTRDWTQAAIVTVKPGKNTPDVSFLNMQPRTAAAVYAMETFAYLPPGSDGVAVPAPALISGSHLYLVFYAPGTTVNGGTAITPGLTVSPIGSAATTGALSYWEQGFNKVVLDTNTVTAPTPVALAVTVPNAKFGSDLYVLPSAFSVVSAPPPLITGVSDSGKVDSAGDPIVTIAGTNLNAATRVLFDGSPAITRSVNDDGSLTVSAPPASAGYIASVEALSPDGQTSLQWKGITPKPQPYTYGGPANPSITLNVGVLQPGVDSEIDVIGNNTAFLNGQTTAGFGNSDVQVRRIWVYGPQRLLLDVSVLPTAQPGPVQLTVSSGNQTETLTAVAQILAANPAQISLRYPALNQITGLDGLQAGSAMVIGSYGVPDNLFGWTLLVDGVATSPSVINRQLFALVPPGTPPGPAIIQLVSPNGDPIPPLIAQVDTPPPQIVGLLDINGQPMNLSDPVHQGDTITLLVNRLADSAPGASLPSAGQVSIDVGSLADAGLTVHETASSLADDSDQPGITKVQFVLSNDAPIGSQQTMILAVGTRVSPLIAGLTILGK